MRDKSTVFVMEQNHPLPNPQRNKKGTSKYSFMRNMAVGDSFLVKDGTKGYSLRGFVGHLGKLRKDTGNTYTYRTYYGIDSRNTPSIRIWRLT